MDPISRLTPEELKLIEDTHFFQTKAIVTRKIKAALNALHAGLREEIQSAAFLAPDGVDVETGQFVKGEHLLDFPYLYLDLPKLFTHQEKFTFRSLFWWGHHLVFAWILEGTHLSRYKQNLIDAYADLADQGLFLLMTETPWEWRSAPIYVLEIRMDNREEVSRAVTSRTFLKIQRFVPFDHPSLLEGRIVEMGRSSFRLMRPVVSP